MSAAAHISVFSWDGVTEAFWVAKVLWYWGICFAFFSLVNSTITELLDLIPATNDTIADAGDRSAVLPLIVSIRTSKNPGASLPSFEQCRPSWLMVYVWQCPVMLMSWSWVCFFAGFILYILTPAIPRHHREHEVQVSPRHCTEKCGMISSKADASD